MTPENVGGNFWKISKDEYLEGTTSDGHTKVQGPLLDRVHLYPDQDKIVFQVTTQNEITGKRITAIEINGTDFEDVVKKTPKT